MCDRVTLSFLFCCSSQPIIRLTSLYIVICMCVLLRFHLAVGSFVDSDGRRGFSMPVDARLPYEKLLNIKWVILFGQLSRLNNVPHSSSYDIYIYIFSCEEKWRRMRLSDWGWMAVKRRKRVPWWLMGDDDEKWMNLYYFSSLLRHPISKARLTSTSVIAELFFALVKFTLFLGMCPMKEQHILI